MMGQAMDTDQAHLAHLLEAAGLTQSARNCWLPRDGEPLTRAAPPQ